MPSMLSIIQSYFPKVSNVVDAKVPRLIEVTRQDVRPQGRKTHDYCAMAEACKRTWHLDGAVVSKSAYLIKGNQATRYQLPASVAKEIVSFKGGAGGASHNRNNKKRFQHTTTGVRKSLVSQ